MNILFIVEAEFIGSKAWVRKIHHGEDMIGRNFVAVIGGSLCECEWCADLKKRIQSRRIY